VGLTDRGKMGEIMSKREEDLVKAIIEIADNKPRNILEAAQIMLKHCSGNIKSVTLKGHVNVRRRNYGN